LSTIFYKRRLVLKLINSQIFIITGYSGSGKSTAIAAFEDTGYFCVDNMPVTLLPKFLELPIKRDLEIAGLGFVMDIREKSFLENYPEVFKSLKQKGYNLKILFLEADDDILLQRYNQTRRHHPLNKGKNLLDSIRLEKVQLQSLKSSSDKIINTSQYNVHELKSLIKEISKYTELKSLSINIISFGFKYGVPNDVNLIIDIRFLENPYFIQELKELDGEDDAVARYILNNRETRLFLKKYLDLLDYLIPLYKKEGKAYLTIAVGCTGGRHRSVTIARYIFEHIMKTEKQVELLHRDIDKSPTQSNR